MDRKTLRDGLGAAMVGLGLSTLAASPVMAADEAQPAKPRLERVAEFPHQVTGVTISGDGRIFVNFPRWTEDAPISVAEVMKDGSLKPYPDAEWNGWRNVKKDVVSPGDHFVCVQSVVADQRGNLWVVDAAAPAQGAVVPEGPKLVQIDLKSNRVVRVYPFGNGIAHEASYLNDVRISPDGDFAYLTDSGARGALIVVDLGTGDARRVLDGHPSTQPEKGLVVQADGHDLRRPDGRGVEFAADGIALSKDGSLLYWQAIKGKTLYRIPTKALQTDGLRGKDVALAVEPFGSNGVADGLLIASGSGRLYITSPEDNSVKVRDLSGAHSKPTTLIQDERLRWPDTFAQAADGTVYVTTSRIQDSAYFKPDAPAALTTQLWRLEGTAAAEEATGALPAAAPPAKQ